jgi:hypothetical protein
MKDRERSHAATVANMFEDVETQAFAAMGIDILWVDEYDEIPELVRYVGGLDHIRIPKWRKKQNVWDDLRLVGKQLRAAEQ